MGPAAVTDARNIGGVEGHPAPMARRDPSIKRDGTSNYANIAQRMRAAKALFAAALPERLKSSTRQQRAATSATLFRHIISISRAC
jgi:hypothetical protein